MYIEPYLRLFTNVPSCKSNIGPVHPLECPFHCCICQTYPIKPAIIYSCLLKIRFCRIVLLFNTMYTPYSIFIKGLSTEQPTYSSDFVDSSSLCSGVDRDQVPSQNHAVHSGSSPCPVILHGMLVGKDCIATGRI